MPTFRDNLSVPSSRAGGPIGCPENSVRNYHVTLRKIPEERRAHGNLSSLQVQLGAPLKKNIDLRSAVYRAFAVQTFPKVTTVWRHFLSSPSPDLSACDYFLWYYLKRRVFQTRSADLQNLKLRISEKRNAISPTTSALWKVL
jgi:hypothetical protein